MAKNDDTSRKSTSERQDEAEKARNEDPAQTVVQENPDLDPNEPGIDEVERNRRREELAKRQG